jgi:hypothetical protein
MLEKSFQAQFLIPMAASIAFGEIFATVLVLYLVPVLYSLYGSVSRDGPLPPGTDDFRDTDEPYGQPQEPSIELTDSVPREPAAV